MTNLEGPPRVSLSIVSGDGQTGRPNFELPEALVVSVTGNDKQGRARPLKGMLVNFRVARGGGTVYAGAALTDKNGVARDY